MVAQPAGAQRAPASIEDFLFNLHSTLVAGPSPMLVDDLKEAYSKKHGHKCVIERWLVVGDGGLAATLKRIPHVVSVFEANGKACVKTALPANGTKETLIEADLNFRKELQRKNAAAKAAKAGAPTAAAPAKAAPPAAAAAGPTRPPATVEDFLWNVHQVLEACPAPLPIDDLKDAYSKQLGHKCAIERFLVVGDVGLAGTLKRIPHVVTVTVATNGQATLTPTLPKGSGREALKQADLDYRKSLQQKGAAAKAAQAGGKAAPPAKPASPTAAGTTRPSEGGGEPDAKKQKPAGDAETLSRMLIQGVVRVLQHQAKEGKASLLVSQLPEEFKTFWKVPFNLQSAGFTDASTFLKAWPNKVEVTSDASGDSVALVKKAGASAEPDAKAPVPAAKTATAAKAPAAAPAPASSPSPTSDLADGEPDAKKAKTTDMDTLSRMLVQGVVRVLQSRAKEGKTELLVSSLADEFKALWKVPFNLASAGYTDVNAFLKAWPNKVELSSSPAGDVVALAKKGLAEKPKEPVKAPVTAAKSMPAEPPAAAKSVAAVASSDGDAPIPSSDAEIRKELTRNAQELEEAAKRQQGLVLRQKALIEALARV